MSVRTGAGFNYAFLRHKSAIRSLEIPDGISFIEGGLAEIAASEGHRKISDSMGLSVHFSRTPITEGRAHQDAFIQHVKHALGSMSPELVARIESIGLHLSGSRFTGIGLFGGADTYIANPACRERAIDFIIQLRKATGKKVWLENANYYSADAPEAIETWADMRQICAETDSGIILDLAHILIEAHNCNIDPLLLIGQVPFEKVAEIHLSGITSSNDGFMHDGHGNPVAEEVWRMLDENLAIFKNYNPETIITIEHTAPSWKNNTSAFHEDFHRLGKLISRPPEKPRMKNPIRYMRGYLRYILRTDIPKLPKACSERGIDFDKLLDEWLRLAHKSGKRVVVAIDDIPDGEMNESWEIRRDFLSYAKTRLRAADDERY